MSIQIKLAVACASLLLGLAPVQAQTTNLVQTVAVALTATAQGQIITNLVATATTLTTNIFTNINTFAVTTRSLITDLGSLLETNFTAQAQLLRIRPVTSPESNPRFFIRDVVNLTNVYFPISSNQLQSGTIWSVTHSTTTSGKSVGTVYGNGYFLLSSATLGAAMQAYTTTTLGTEAMSAFVQGSGVFTNAIAIYRGTINFSAQSVAKDLPLPEP